MSKIKKLKIINKFKKLAKLKQNLTTFLIVIFSFLTLSALIIFLGFYLANSTFYENTKANINTLNNNSFENFNIYQKHNLDIFFDNNSTSTIILYIDYSSIYTKKFLKSYSQIYKNYIENKKLNFIIRPISINKEKINIAEKNYLYLKCIQKINKTDAIKLNNYLIYSTKNQSYLKNISNLIIKYKKIKKFNECLNNNTYKNYFLTYEKNFLSSNQFLSPTILLTNSKTTIIGIKNFKDYKKILDKEINNNN